MPKLNSLLALFCTFLLMLCTSALWAQAPTATIDSTLKTAFHALAQKHDAMRGNPAAQAALNQDFSALYSGILEQRNAGTKPSISLYDEAIAAARTFGLVRNAMTLLQLQEADHPPHITECHCGKCHKD